MKMMARAPTSAVLACLALLGGSGRAMDLQEAYQAALLQDATTRAARAAVAAGDERIRQAEAQRYPNVSLSAGYQRNNLDRTQPNILGEDATVNDRYPSKNATLTVRQPLYRKAITLGIEQTRAQRDDAQAGLQKETQRLAVRVADAYTEILFARDQLDFIAAQKAATTTQLDAARKQFAGGTGTRTDIDEAQARLDMALAQELEARQQQGFAQRQLSLLINAPVNLEALRPLAVDRLAAWSPPVHNLEEWLAQAEARSPELRQLQARLESARLDVEKARAGHLPTLDAVAQWSRSESESVTSPNTRYVNRTIGVQLNMPLYAGGYVNAATREALARQTQAEELLEAARRDLALRVTTEFRNVTEGRLRVHALEQAERSAEQLAQSSRKSMRGGVRTLVDVFNADQKKAQTQRDLARARYEMLVAYVRLLALTGSDEASGIAAVNGLLR
ncbi:TolC family outer membrane protein [Acidovorax sp.]|uniref:TolC family outer membrane protein n=1 Tax=Acidovorax sp. TaxID=1872122 RepID=UPI0025B86AE0|nr:TolC family outer membrane protein [Acidovorax sp.]MCI5068065.1 TolC family outer membrane protein [Acidovorax sp.]